MGSTPTTAQRPLGCEGAVFPTDTVLHRALVTQNHAVAVLSGDTCEDRVRSEARQ